MLDNGDFAIGAYMRVKYLFFCLLAVSIWAGNTIVCKLAAGMMPPSAIAFERWLVAFIILTPFVAKDVWQHRRKIGMRLPKLAVLGLLGMAICQGLGYYAAGFTSATNMAILLSLVPLLTLVLSAVIVRETPSKVTILGGILSLFGIFIVLGKGDPSVLLSQGVGRGDALMLVVVSAYAIYGVLLKNWSAGLPLFVSLYVQIGCAVLLLLPSYLLGGSSTLSAANVSMILYAAIPGSIVAPFVWMSAVTQLGAGRTTVFMNLIPILTALAAALFLNETLHFYHVVGGGLTIVGIILSQKKADQPIGNTNMAVVE
jgi:drug/metabolite transporter (DMT)-like permease